MLLPYFGFKEEPFGITPDPGCIYPSQTHRESLASIRCAFQSNRGFTALIAPPGMGKTTLVRRFLEDVRETTCCVFLFDIDADCKPREFLGYILREIGITPGNSSSEMHEQLSDALVREARAGRQFVVVIDEAQNLSAEVLERVRLLTNFETSRGKLMHIILSGQPELSKKLLQPSLAQLRQRISMICRLEPLSNRETASYIDYRLNQAGYEGDALFTEGAISQIAEASKGIPRIINNLCFNSLALCCALKSRQVDANMAAEAIADLRLTTHAADLSSGSCEMPIKTIGKLRRRPTIKALFQNWAMAPTILTIVCAFVVLGFAQFRVLRSGMSRDIRSLSQTSAPSSVQNPAKAVIRQDNSPSQKVEPLAVTVELDQTLRDISTRYLGGYDKLRLGQIRALNPWLIDPNHIEAGQKILLPRLSPESLARGSKQQGSERTLP